METIFVICLLVTIPASSPDNRLRFDELNVATAVQSLLKADVCFYLLRTVLFLHFGI